MIGLKSRGMQPTMEPNRSGSVQSTDGQGSHCPDGTSVEDTAMVPSNATNASCNTTSDQSPSHNAEQRSGGPCPSTSHVVSQGEIPRLIAFIGCYFTHAQVMEI